MRLAQHMNKYNEHNYRICLNYIWLDFEFIGWNDRCHLTIYVKIADAYSISDECTMSFFLIAREQWIICSVDRLTKMCTSHQSVAFYLFWFSKLANIWSNDISLMVETIILLYSNLYRTNNLHLSKQYYLLLTNLMEFQIVYCGYVVMWVQLMQFIQMHVDRGWYLLTSLILFVHQTSDDNKVV